MLTCSVYVLIHPRRPRCLRLIKKIQQQERAWRLANSICGGSREGAPGGGGGLIFRPNLKHFLETKPPTLSRGLDDLTPPPPPPPPPLLLSGQDKTRQCFIWTHYRGSVLWNKIPSEIRKLPSLNVFKTSIHGKDFSNTP